MRKKKTRSTFGGLLSKSSDYITDTVTSKDIYGQPVVLNYKGEDTFKTFPGGLLSIFVILAIFMYTVLKTLQMVQVQNWSLTQQVVVSEETELKNPKFFNESQYSNLTVSLQLSAKKKKATMAAKASAQAANKGRKGPDGGGGKGGGPPGEFGGGDDFEGFGGKRQLAFESEAAR